MSVYQPAGGSTGDLGGWRCIRQVSPLPSRRANTFYNVARIGTARGGTRPVGGRIAERRKIQCRRRGDRTCGWTLGNSGVPNGRGRLGRSEEGRGVAGRRGSARNRMKASRRVACGSFTCLAAIAREAFAAAARSLFKRLVHARKSRSRAASARALARSTELYLIREACNRRASLCAVHHHLRSNRRLGGFSVCNPRQQTFMVKAKTRCRCLFEASDDGGGGVGRTSAT